jgi:hypothetical protein
MLHDSLSESTACCGDSKCEFPNCFYVNVTIWGYPWDSIFDFSNCLCKCHTENSIFDFSISQIVYVNETQQKIPYLISQIVYVNVTLKILHMWFLGLFM